MAAMNRVIAIIQTIPKANQRILLMHRYIDGMSWQDIVDTERMSWTWAISNHRKALESLQL